MPARGSFRARHGISADVFVALYSGNLGVKQGLDILVEAARLLQHGNGGDRSDSQNIKIVIAGDGSRREYLRQFVGRLALNNVLLLPLQEEQAYREMLSDCDCSVITQQEGTGSFFLPSKLLTSLAAAKPIISVADESSELAKACLAGGFGVNIRPNHAEALANAISSFARERTLADRVDRA
jgi:colanic acid biosynthesis glycosyl transferase WcaI